jgi:hypothetical protein
MRIIILVLTIVFGLGGVVVLQSGCKSKSKAARTIAAQENPANQIEKPVVEEKTRTKESAPVQIGIDQTASGDATVLETSIENLREMVELQRTPKVAVVRLGEGGKTSWAQSAQLFNLPLPPIEVFDAAAADGKIEQSCRTRLKCRQERLQKMREEFDSLQAEKRKAAQTERRAKSQEIADLLLLPAKGTAPCTDLVDFRDRLLADGYKLIVFYTDGDHDCPAEITTKSFPPDVKVLVLQLPLKGENSGAAFAERTKVLERIFSGDGVTVTPVVSADENTFAQFLQ